MPKAVSSTYCSSRGPKFNSQHQCWMVHNYLLTPAAGDLTSMAYVGIHAQVHTPDTHIYVIKNKAGW